MLKNYLKIAWQNLWRNKAFSLINIFGLAVGLASCLLLFMYLSHELSYDNFHEKANRIVRVTMEFGLEGKVSKAPVTGTKVGPEFGRQFPEVESAVRLLNGQAVVRYGDQQFSEKRFVYADSSLFNIFSFRRLKGNPQQALAGPNLVVLSESTARKYFGNEEPAGKTLRVNTGRSNKDFTVTGVVQDCPANSQIKYDLLASLTTLPVAREPEQWYSANYVYLPAAPARVCCAPRGEDSCVYENAVRRTEPDG